MSAVEIAKAERGQGCVRKVCRRQAVEIVEEVEAVEEVEEVEKPLRLFARKKAQHKVEGTGFLPPCQGGWGVSYALKYFDR